jgi:hypothetical protein
MFCPSCGVESTNKTKYCKSCGATMNSTGPTVEIHIQRPPVAAMTFAIAAFGIIGFIASLITLAVMSRKSDLGSEPLIAILFFCLMFVFMVAGLLSWQLGRLIGAYRDTIKRTIESEKVETAIPSQPVFPQRQQSYMPPVQEPASSVTEHTTRTFNPSIEK